MKTIKVKYVDFWPDFDYTKDAIYEALLLSNQYSVEISDEPDYIIYSTFGHEHLFYDCIKIFYSGEDQSPDFNICDYAVSFEYIHFLDRHFRLPLMYQPGYRVDYNRMIQKEKNFLRKNKFCSFVYSNAKADAFRGEFCDQLALYKKVDSGGKYKNNIGGAVVSKYKFEKEYKFSIAFENVSHPGYMTEKLMQSFAAGCIPIYWGDPLIGESFNTDAFVNVMDFPNVQKAIEYIVYLDQDEKAYNAMIGKPALRENKKIEVVQKELIRFVNHIFGQPLNEAKRTTGQYWNRNYVESKRRQEK
jgi:hypothetical protein